MGAKKIMKKKKESSELNLNLDFLKKNWNWAVLIAILIFAFILRAYHINYPVVGYHNWKETHYLVEGRNFARDGFFKHGFFTPAWDYPAIHEGPSGVHSDSFPTSSILNAIGFKIFGYELWVARGINILLALGSIFFLYLLVKKLFKNEQLALTSALLMALNPLFVFFGRQVQLINPAMFFGILGFYFYILWLEEKSWKNTIIFSLSILLCIITKYTFALFAIPIVLAFPFKDYLKNFKTKIKKEWRKFSFIVLMPILGLWWYVYSAQFSANIGRQVSTARLSLLFDSSFWAILKSFAADNYTILGVWLSIFGLILFTLMFIKNREKMGYRFFMGYVIGSIIWFGMLTGKLKGHNYHQYPFVPIVVFLIAFFFVSISQTISKMIGKGKIRELSATVIIIILCFIMIGPSFQAKDRMFDTQFFGLDIAGEYLQQNGLDNERVMHSSHQAFGILWHSDMKGVKGVKHETVEDYKFAEEDMNVTWLFIYSWDFDIFNNENISKYISENYELKQAGLMARGTSMSPVYFLFKKGGEFDMSRLNDYMKNASIRSKEYELSSGKVQMNFAIFP